MAERLKRGGHRKPAGEKTGSGIQRDGTWVPVFAGQRPPFEPGVATTETHGSHASIARLGARPQEIADAIRPFVAAYSPGVEPIVQCYAVTLTRIERGAHALDAVEEGTDIGESYKRREDDMLMSLRKDLRAWIRLSVTLAGELGLTPSSAARILRDVGVGAHAAAQHADLLAKYRGAA